MRKQKYKQLDNINVRPVMKGDIEYVQNIFTDKRLVQQAGLVIGLNKELQRWAIQNWIADQQLFGIFIQNKLVGILLENLQDGVMDIGYLVHPRWQDQHVMTKALKIFIDRFTNSIKISASVSKNNLPSQRVLLNNHFSIVKQDNGIIFFEKKADIQ